MSQTANLILIATHLQGKFHNLFSMIDTSITIIYIHTTTCNGFKPYPYTCLTAHFSSSGGSLSPGNMAGKLADSPTSPVSSPDGRYKDKKKKKEILMRQLQRVNTNSQDLCRLLYFKDGMPLDNS